MPIEPLPDDMRTGCCINCVFWEEMPPFDDGLVMGLCRRHAPQAATLTNPSPDQLAVWPETDETDWCGDYQPAKQ